MRGNSNREKEREREEERGRDRGRGREGEGEGERDRGREGERERGREGEARLVRHACECEESPVVLKITVCVELGDGGAIGELHTILFWSRGRGAGQISGHCAIALCRDRGRESGEGESGHMI
jgi:hypothetical protein